MLLFLLLLLLQMLLEFVLVKGEIEEPGGRGGGAGVIVHRRAIKTRPVTSAAAEGSAGARGVGRGVVGDRDHHHGGLRTRVVVQTSFEAGGVGGGGGSRGVWSVEPGMRWSQDGGGIVSVLKPRFDRPKIAECWNFSCFLMV